MTRQTTTLASGCLGLAAIVIAASQGWMPTPRLLAAAQPASSWVERAAHNFGGPINTKWDEGELSFADDGTMVFTSSRQDLAVAPGDPKDLYLATFNADTGTWNKPVNMGLPVNAAPATSVDPLRKGDDREPWITPDGNTIYFKSDRLATTTPRNINDIFVTHKVNGTWSTPELLPAPISTDTASLALRIRRRRGSWVNVVITLRWLHSPVNSRIATTGRRTVSPRAATRR